MTIRAISKVSDKEIYTRMYCVSPQQIFLVHHLTFCDSIARKGAIYDMAKPI